MGGEDIQNMQFATSLLQKDLVRKENGTTSKIKKLSRLVPKEGVEPSRPKGHMALNHACLPIPALGYKKSSTL